MVNATPKHATHRTSQMLRADADTGLYFRVATSLPLTDPWALGSALRKPGESCVFWNQGDMCFAAVGTISQRDFEGSKRFDKANAWASSIRSRVLNGQVDGYTGHVPLLVGGFAFADQMNVNISDPWLGWSPGSLRVPRLVIYRNGTECIAVGTERLRVAQQPLGSLEKLREEVNEALDGLSETACHLTTVRMADQRGPKSRFETCVENALGEIGHDQSVRHLSKVVLSRRATFQSEAPLEPTVVMNSLRSDHPGCVTFAFSEANGRTFVGATPELLVRKEGNLIHTRALAGTRALEGAESGQTLLASAKDQHEHALVVEAVEEALTTITQWIETPREPGVRTLRNIVHLESAITAQLQESSSILDAVRCLHPTPAVGGFPKQRASDFIRAHEADERGWYTGPLGWIDTGGNGEFHVALRCGMLDGCHAWGFVGAGIVEGSNPSSEWDETALKLKTFQRALGRTERDV